MGDWLIAFFATCCVTLIMIQLQMNLVGFLSGQNTHISTIFVKLGFVINPLIGWIVTYFLLVRGKGAERQHGFWTAISVLFLLVSFCFGVITK